MPRLWSAKLLQRCQVSEMQKQESALEETGSHPLKQTEIAIHPK